MQKRKGRVACHIFDSKKCAIYRPCLDYLSEKNSRPANSEEDIKQNTSITLDFHLETI